MAGEKMEATVREADGVTVVDLTGFLDTGTVPAFEEVVRRFVAEGRLRVVVSFGGLHYTSSGGVGLLMGALSDLRSAKAEIRLVGMSPKVRKVFDLLGFNDIVRILDTEEDALRELRGGEVATEAPVTFPVRIACSGCQAEYNAPKVGMYRCRKCNEIFFVDSRAKVSLIRKGGSLPTSPVRRVELHVPADVNYLQHLRRFVTGAVAEEGFDEEKVNQIEMAFDEAITNVIEHAYNFDSTQTIDIVIQFDADKMTLTLLDRGKGFTPDTAPLPDLKQHIAQRKTGGLGRYLIQMLLDESRYGRTADGRNELVLVKYVKGKS